MVQQTLKTDVGQVVEKLAYQHTLDFALLAPNLKTAKVTVSNSEIKALAATQKELVAAPGTGKMLEFVSAVLRLVAGTEALTETDYNLAIKYTDDAGVAVSDAIESTGFVDQTADTLTRAVPVKDAIVAESACEDEALVLDNTGGGEIAGNASNDAYMEVFITWREHELA